MNYYEQLLKASVGIVILPLENNIPMYPTNTNVRLNSERKNKLYEKS